jgi:hypothetical protein
MGNLGGTRGEPASEPARLLTGWPPLAFSKASHSILVQIDLIDKSPSLLAPSTSLDIARPSAKPPVHASLRHALPTHDAAGNGPSWKATLSRNQPLAGLLEAFGLLIQQPYRLRNALCGSQTLSNSSGCNHG